MKDNEEREEGYYWVISGEGTKNETRVIAEWDGALWSFCGSDWLALPSEFEQEGWKVLSQVEHPIK